MKKLMSLLALMLFLVSTVAVAHPGRTDKNGGHKNRKTGQYHKHDKDGKEIPAEKPKKADKKAKREERRNNKKEKKAAKKANREVKKK